MAFLIVKRLFSRHYDTCLLTGAVMDMMAGTMPAVTVGLTMPFTG